MEISGKVHCFFEQSGTFKNEFKKLGYEAEDYDIHNNFGETDNVVDLFAEIEKGYDNQSSIFDKMGGGDLIIAFFPCIYFCDSKTMAFKGVSNFQQKWPLEKVMEFNIEQEDLRHSYFSNLMKLVKIVSDRGLRMIIENPWNTSGETFLQRNFIKPTIIDSNRMRRGDWFVKPTAYWFIGCSNTWGYSEQKDKKQKIVYKVNDKKQQKGICSEGRSMICHDYARNFICDFILGKKQEATTLTLF